MIEILETDRFVRWMARLGDDTAAAIISARIDRLQKGLPGDVRSVGAGVSEMRIDHGPGYRVYFTRTGKALIVILCGGDKSSQRDDIRLAKEMAMQSRKPER